MLYFMVFLGAFFILLKNLNKAWGHEDFKWLIFIRKNAADTVLNVLAGAILIYSFDIHKGLFHYNNIDFTMFFCVFLGVSGQTVINAILTLTNKKYKTWFGINKKK